MRYKNEVDMKKTTITFIIFALIIGSAYSQNKVDFGKPFFIQERETAIVGNLILHFEHIDRIHGGRGRDGRVTYQSITYIILLSDDSEQFVYYQQIMSDFMNFDPQSWEELDEFFALGDYMDSFFFGSNNLARRQICARRFRNADNFFFEWKNYRIYVLEIGQVLKLQVTKIENTLRPCFWRRVFFTRE